MGYITTNTGKVNVVVWLLRNSKKCFYFTKACRSVRNIGNQQQSSNEHGSGLLWEHCSRSYLVPVALPLPSGLSWTSPFPLALGVSGKGLACNAWWWFPQCVSYPAPLPTSYLHIHFFLSSFPPLVFIWDPLRPSDVEDAAETGVVRDLDPLQGCFCCLPGLRCI